MAEVLATALILDSGEENRIVTKTETGTEVGWGIAMTRLTMLLAGGI